MRYEFTIIVPVHNEEENLWRLEKELSLFIGQAGVSSKVLFVEDGSGDNSLALIEAICTHNPHFTYISFDRNRGLSAAIKAGFDNTETNLVGYIDADLQTTPEDFNLLLTEIRDCDLVTGYRWERRNSFIKRVSSIIANKIRRAFTHDGMDDTGCPLKIIRIDFARKIPMFNGLHRFLPAMILLQGGRIKQIPVRHFPRIAGKPHFGLWNRFLGPFADCFAYLWMKKKYIRYRIVKRG